MGSCTDVTDYELMCVVVTFGLGSKVLHTAKRCGMFGGTIFLGKGTVNSRILKMLSLSDIGKEILIMVSNRTVVRQTLETLNKEFRFDRPGHGIAFTTSVSSVAGARSCKGDRDRNERGENDTMYQLITAIVDKGRAEEVIDAAVKAGSSGGTIINARGSGIHETSKLFAMDIEPEKEIVMILAAKETTEAIVSNARQQLDMDEPGNGIIFVQDINKTYGL